MIFPAGQNVIFTWQLKSFSAISKTWKFRRGITRLHPDCDSLLAAPNRGIQATMVRPRDQNAAGKIGETGPAGYTHGKAAPRSTQDQVVWLHLWPGLALSWCGSSRTIRDCWKPLGVESWVLLELLPPWPSQEEKRTYENEWKKSGDLSGPLKALYSCETCVKRHCNAIKCLTQHFQQLQT